jgi:hypothetical protein
VRRRINQEKKFKYIDTLNLNKDVLENTFSAIHLHIMVIQPLVDVALNISNTSWNNNASRIPFSNKYLCATSNINDIQGSNE